MTFTADFTGPVEISVNQNSIKKVGIYVHLFLVRKEIVIYFFFCFKSLSESKEGNQTIYQTACGIQSKENWPLFQVIFFLLSYVVPLTLICGLYVCMLSRLWRAARSSAESRRGRKRVTRLVLVVVGVFALCWCPIQVRTSHNLPIKFPFNTI